MYTHLYALGCSWTEGTDDEKNKDGWVGRLSKQLSCPYTNLGGQGDSNWLQYLAFSQLTLEPNSVCVWGLTAFSRLVKQLNNQFETIHSSEFDKNFMLRFYHDSVVQYQTLVLVAHWQNYCKQHNVESLLFVSFDDIERINGNYKFPMCESIYSQLDYSRIIADTTMRSYLDGDSNICGDVVESQKYLQKYFGRQSVQNKVNLKCFSKDGHPNANGYSKWADYLYNRLTNEH